MSNVHKARLDVQSNYILIALLCIDSPISCNICEFEVYKGHMGQAILISSRNFPVNTDRWAAAVVAIDQLPRKIASVTDTKRTNKRHERR